MQYVSYISSTLKLIEIGRKYLIKSYSILFTNCCYILRVSHQFVVWDIPFNTYFKRFHSYLANLDTKITVPLILLLQEVCLFLSSTIG